MRLLFDQNLSPRLVRLLSDVYPECSHVQDLGLDRSRDTEVWDYAAKHGYAIVSKDADFHQRSLLLGPPPKVVWIRLGNCSVTDTATLTRGKRRHSWHPPKSARRCVEYGDPRGGMR